MFGKRKNKAEHYDRENLRPVIRASICTGEQVAGFKNIHTGKFEDVMLIRDNRDIKQFHPCRNCVPAEIGLINIH